MTTTQPSPTITTLTLRPGRLAGRCAVALILVCVGVHVVGAAQHWAMSPFISAATIIVAAGCLQCVRCLWMKPTIRGWLHVTTGFGLMLALHAIMMWEMATPMTGASVDNHHGAGMRMATGPAANFGALTYTGLVIPILGIALAWCALGSTRPTGASDQQPDACSLDQSLAPSSDPRLG